jgi:hypothetical protein
MKKEDKDLVINMLAEQADGMYLNLFTFVIFFLLSNRFRCVLLVESLKGLSSTERSAIFQGITGIIG